MHDTVAATRVLGNFASDEQKELWQNYRIATEPGGAAAYGALLSGAYRPQAGEQLGILVCGANVQLPALDQTINDI